MLEVMEAAGWRLTEVSLGFIFRFRRFKPKDVRYVWMCHNLKRTEPFEVWEAVQSLKTQWNADPISTWQTKGEFLRLTRLDADLVAFQAVRKAQLQRLIRGKLLVSVLAAVFFLVTVLAGAELPAFLGLLALISCVIYYSRGVVMCQ